jgi:hypothetical protein
MKRAKRGKANQKAFPCFVPVVPQISEKETQLLRYLVFAAVTARIETTVTSTLVKDGFSLSKQACSALGKARN